MTTRRAFLAGAAAAAATPLLSRPSWAAAPQAPAASLEPWIEVDANALRHNVETLRRMSGKPIIAVVKNNAYGLGLELAGPVLDARPEVVMLAVVRPQEALALRRAGAHKPILLMGPATEEELMELVPLDVVQSPYRDVAPVLLSRVAQRLGRAVRVHLYIDTGMHRMGMGAAGLLPWISAMTAARGVRVEGAFTELVEDADFDPGQAARLEAVRAALSGSAATSALLHAASSDAVLHAREDTYLDAVRPGLALCGGYVSEATRQAGGLRPAYRLKARVIRVDRLAMGEGVSYHRRWKADKPTTIATLAIGHVDGYPSGAVKGGEVLLRGKPYPVVGTVSSSHTIIALGDDPVQVGDEATLVGPDHPAIHPNEVAKRAGYSEYDMFMHLSPTLRRVAT